jgi:hypothetical protein
LRSCGSQLRERLVIGHREEKIYPGIAELAIRVSPIRGLTAHGRVNLVKLVL